MIFTVRKNIYIDNVDTVVKNCLGEEMFIVKPIKNAYMIFNTAMVAIAEIRFDKKSAIIKIAESQEEILIDYINYNGVLDGEKLLNIIGNVGAYTYDGYYGNKIQFQLVPNSLNDNYYQIKILEGNALKFILVSLALEKIILGNTKKK